MSKTYDCVVVGGGPSGATAAADLARAGRSVLLLDRGGRIKPCGGAIPPKLIADFSIPDELIVGRADLARMIAPSERAVDMPVGAKDSGAFVGMVDRETFDEYLRNRATSEGASIDDLRNRTIELCPKWCVMSVKVEKRYFHLNNS
jgi:flavin-dependent dehydrogenase